MKNKTNTNVVDKFLFNLIDNRLFELVLILALAISAIIRVMLAPYTDISPDYDTYYKVWVETYREVGIWKGLSMTIGDYYVPFNILYAICSLLPCEPWAPLAFASCLCEYVGALFMFKIIRMLLVGSGYDERKAFKIASATAVGLLFIPIVIFNGALWKQCDAMYTCFIIIAIYYMIKDKYTTSFIFLGIAFAFKLQAIFVIPAFLIIYMVKKRFTIFQFCWIPAIFLLFGIPAVLAKRGLRATYFMYFMQTQETQSEGYGMVSYLPNLYNFGFDDYDYMLNSVAVLMIGVIFMFAALFMVWANRRYVSGVVCAMDSSVGSAIDSSVGLGAVKANDGKDSGNCVGDADVKASGADLLCGENILYLAIWSAFTCCMFLPGMHERYDYMVIFMLTGYAFALRQKLIPCAIVINVISLITYGHILFKVETIPTYALAIPYLLIYLWITRDVIRKFCGKE